MTSPLEQLHALPLFCKIFVVSGLVTATFSTFGALNPGWMAFSVALIRDRFQIWRFITPFLFFGKFGSRGAVIAFLINMIILVRYVGPCERELFESVNNARGKADFAYFLIFCSICLMLIAGSFGFLGEGLIFSVMYYWCRKHAFKEVQLWIFPFQFKNWYFPFVICILDMIILPRSAKLDLMAILVGHLYYFLKDVVPVLYGKNWLKTPECVVCMFDQTQRRITRRRQTWRNTKGHSLKAE